MLAQDALHAVERAAHDREVRRRDIVVLELRARRIEQARVVQLVAVRPLIERFRQQL